MRHIQDQGRPIEYIRSPLSPSRSNLNAQPFYVILVTGLPGEDDVQL